jgi:hypothetical protein
VSRADREIRPAFLFVHAPRYDRAVIRGCVVLGFAAAICFAGGAGDFAGIWFLKSGGQAFFKLTITTKDGHVAGSLTKPHDLTIDQDGAVTHTGGSEVTMPIQRAALKADRLELTINDDDFVVTHEKDGALLMRMEHMRPWTLERGPNDLRLATSVSKPRYPAEIVALRAKLHGMVEQDQAARLAFDEKKTNDIDTGNRPELLRIYNHYGWVTNSLAGKDAAHDFWLLVQHQPLDIQQRMLPALKAAAGKGDASMADYAYLYDRVQMGRGKPQHWGTQVKCHDGKPSLYPVDDPAGLDGRRKELFMLPASDYLRADYLVKLCGKQTK